MLDDVPLSFIHPTASSESAEAEMVIQALLTQVFKGEVSPDGRAEDEINITCFVRHPNLIRHGCQGKPCYTRNDADIDRFISSACIPSSAF